MSKKRRNHAPPFKAKVALAAIKGDETLSNLASRYDINANLIVKWKKQLLDSSAEVFASGTGLSPNRESEIKSLQAKIGEITMGKRFFIKSARSLNRPERKTMINKSNKLSLVRQCKLLKIHRSHVYYKTSPANEDDLELMHLIDRIHLNRPFLGSRRIRDVLQDVGHRVDRKHVRRLMRKMGIKAIYPRPNTSKKKAGHKIYPYLLGGLAINQPNQAWCTDITYIPMPKGFAYLTVVMDWYSRKVLSWRLSNSMDSAFCVDALEEALHYYGKPDIFNSDQGAQFTSEAFTGVLKDNGIRISMDGKGAWRDNVFVERLWRSVKYEEVYLQAYQSMKEAKDGIGSWINYYNQERKHQTLGMVPDMMYDPCRGLKLAT